MGRRAHKPDPAQRRQVEAMAAYGIPEIDIARVVGVDPKTLRKHYRDELDLGETKANAQVAGFLFNCGHERQRHGADLLAQDPRPLAGDAPELRHSGAIATKDFSQLSDEELLAMLTSLAQQVGFEPMTTIVAGGDPIGTGASQANGAALPRLVPSSDS